MSVHTFYLVCGCLLASVLVCTCNPAHDDSSEDHHRHKRSAPTLSNRTHCSPGDQWPPTRVNTTQRLTDLRAAMAAISVDAFIIFSNGAHEYAADSDKRRAFITGFSGSAGYAAVTRTKAALWTDGRYFLEAEDALDCNWIFMKQREPGVPTMMEWLISELTSGQTVGADPFLVTNSQWQSMKKWLEKTNLTLSAVDNNPVDTVWTDQPDPPNTTINALEMKYAGRRWQDKITDVHTAMEENGVHGAYVVTSLDEVAWLFNLRAADIPHNPFFISYATVEYYGESNNTVRLYIYDKETRLTANPTDTETTHTLYQHLNTNQDGSCTGKTDMCVEVHDYNPSQVVSDITDMAAASPDSKIWITYVCNYAIFNAVPQAQRFQENSYIVLAKSQKNPTERQGMETCYKRDSAVLIEFFAKLEKEIAEGKNWTEVSAAAELDGMRRAAEKNRGVSFATIAGSGPNGAVIHYRPAPETDRQLTLEEMFLLDSGGQYLDGTTDTTRTVHFGAPTDYEIESYTRVLISTIDLARAVWPSGADGRTLDVLAREPLWKAGLDYNHGTGHGIGAYSTIHEGPVCVCRSDQEVLPNTFISDEPGYYEPGQFGVRLETVLMVEPVHTKHNFGGVQYLHFKPITLVPFEPKLIDYSLMSKHQIAWLNTYHQLTQDSIEPLLTTHLAKRWLRDRTKPYLTPTPTPKPAPTTPCNPAPRPLPTFTFFLLGLAAALTLLF